MTDSGRAARNVGSEALRSPVFLAALALLLLNDHWLKTAGLAPAWLTGKLSDVTGLVVAPVAAAALCRGRLALLARPAAAATVLLFVAIQLSAAAASWLQAAAGLIGLQWRLWPDPTDLVALAVLPLTWRLLRRDDGAHVPSALPRLALATALVACLATSDIDPYVLGPFLVNHSGSQVTLEVAWSRAPVDCDAPLAEVPGGLAPGDLAPRQVQLASSQVARLASPPGPGGATGTPCVRQSERHDDAGLPREACILVRLSGPGLPEHVVRTQQTWESEDTRSRCAPSIPLYEDPGPGALVIGRRSEGGLRLIGHSRVEVLRLP